MEDFEKALEDQRELLDSLRKRSTGEVPFVEFDKLQLGTFMSRFYLTNCLEKGWVIPTNPEIRKLIIGWAREYPEFTAKMLRHNWLSLDEEVSAIILQHACDAPHRYTLHFLLEGWLDPQHDRVRQLIILTLNEGNSSIYVDKGWLSQEEAESILNDFNF